MTTKEIVEKIDRENGWFGRLEDFTEKCGDNGLEVLAINSEYAEVCGEEDDGCLVYFGGTERTITIKHTRPVY